MTSRNTRQAAGRSPQPQQFLDYAAGTSPLPVQGTEPKLRVARLPASGKRGSLPVQRATYHGPVQNSDRPLAGAEPPLQSAGRLFRLTGRGARPHRRRGGTGAHGDLGSDVRRLSAGTPRVLAFRIHLALGHGDDVPATTARPSIAVRRTPTVRPTVAFRRNGGLPTRAARSRAHAPAQAGGTRSRRTRILRSFGSRPVTVAGPWPASSQAAAGRVPQTCSPRPGRAERATRYRWRGRRPWPHRTRRRNRATCGTAGAAGDARSCSPAGSPLPWLPSLR